MPYLTSAAIKIPFQESKADVIFTHGSLCSAHCHWDYITYQTKRPPAAQNQNQKCLLKTSELEENFLLIAFLEGVKHVIHSAHNSRENGS